MTTITPEAAQRANAYTDQHDLTFRDALALHIMEADAFRQEVSDAVVDYCGYAPPDGPSHPITRFIIPAPVDPLVDAVNEAFPHVNVGFLSDKLRAALSRRGLEVRPVGEVGA